MRTEDFDFAVPPDLVAQYPCAKRDECKLLYLARESGAVTDHCFLELPNLLFSGDRLIFNNTRVIPARLLCQKQSGGRVELLLVEQGANGCWKSLIRPGRGLGVGTRVRVCAALDISIEVRAVNSDGSREVFLVPGSPVKDLLELLGRYGVMALPHYIKRPSTREDATAYQTLFAKREGAIASPTAGLHFTPELMKRLSLRGVDMSYVTLHVGIGTFRPVKVSDPVDHVMHEETYELTEETAEEILRTKKCGGRVIAVGTTSVRVLEHCSRRDGLPVPSGGRTGLKILPGYEFKVVDGMVTNFHVPKSTLIMLVSAFAGRERVLRAYSHAVAQGYRFFSYGDAMLIA